MTIDVGTSVSARHPNVATYLVCEALHFVGKSTKRAVTSGLQALTDVPTSLAIQLRKLPVSKPPVRHGLKEIVLCHRWQLQNLMAHRNTHYSYTN